MSFKGFVTGLILASVATMVASAQTPASTEDSAPQPLPVMDLNPKDLLLHGVLKVSNSAIASVLAKLNEQLQFINTSSDAKSLAYREFSNKVAERTKDDPDQPFDNEIISYPHQNLGVNFNASRHVTPRTAKGSRAPLQLVDNLSISAGLGVFHTLDALGSDSVLRYSSTLGAHVSAVRDYTHVRPLKSVQETRRYSWREILIPNYLRSLAEILENSDNPDADSLKVLMNGMQDGEVFSVTDSLATTASLRRSSSLQILFGIPAFPFVDSFSFGAEASRVIIRQVNFHRVVKNDFDGFHVYVRELKNKGRAVEGNVNFFLNLIKVRAQSRASDIQTSAYLFNLKDPANSSLRQKIKTVLPSLLKTNNPDALAREFSSHQFEVQHDLKEEDLRLKLFVWRMAIFQEDHTLDFKTPPIPQEESGISSEKVSLFASRRGRLRGLDQKTFTYDAADALLKYYDLFDRIRIARTSVSASDNPANTVGGRAEWRLVTTEADLSKTTDNLPPMAMIQHVWGGWSLKKNRFLETVSELQNPYLEAGLVKENLVRPEDLNNVKSVDFYRISANATVLEKGLERIRDLLLQPKASYFQPVRGSSLENWFRKMKCLQENPNASCEPEYRVGNDRDFFQEMLRILGNGDMESGRRKYVKACEDQKPMTNSESGTMTSNPTIYRGGLYECLSPWMRKLIKLSHQYPPTDRKGQIRWTTDVLSILDDQIPMQQLLEYIGLENSMFSMQIHGFLVKETGGNYEPFSNRVDGVGLKDVKYQNGLIQYFTRKTGILPVEMERSLGPF